MDRYNTLKVLHEKVNSFFDETLKKYPNQLNCKIGCNQCCHVDLSIFTIEAEFIYDWFTRLEKTKQKKLIDSLMNNQNLGLDLNNQKVKPCIFLRDDKCSIYEARPLICRTHGLAMIRIEPETQKGQVDCCPLNFKDQLPEKDLLLDINKLDSILVNLQLQFNKDKNNPRISLNEVKNELVKLYENN